jgi:uncharacterized protein (DUF305 family)
MAFGKSALVAVAFAVATAASAFGQGGMNVDMQERMRSMMPAATDSASTKGFKEAHMKMMMNSPKDYRGDADVDFVRNMIPHHQGAIDMAKVQLAHGKDPKLRKMAEKMIADQEKEIAELQGWLKQRGQ